MHDPRPDLASDSHLWSTLLGMAYSANPNLYDVLHGMRCQGTQIKKGQKNYALRPIIDPNYGWDSKAEYDKDKHEWLMPHVKELTKLLKIL